MFNSLKFSALKLNIISTLTFALIILIVVFAAGNLSHLSLQLDSPENGKAHFQNHRRTLQPATQLKITSEERFKLNPQQLDLLAPSYSDSTSFESIVERFSTRNKCKTRVFMTWFSPVDLFGKRELFGLESLFHTNPKICLIILSKTMDSKRGREILHPFIGLGFQVRAITPDLWALLKDTPAETWLVDVKNGKTEAGKIPLEQNLSNLIRLATLYKYGGVYLDTDFIFLKDFSGLRNSIGAQSVDVNGKWTRLNNAVLVFDKKHLLLYKFIEEFALGFDGNRWGHNGPYLVSRVVHGLGETAKRDFTILPPDAFYPVHWNRVAGFFLEPSGPVGVKWVEAKTRKLNGSSYGVHLWNSQSRRFKIEEGSIIEGLISTHCVVSCRNIS